MKSIRETFLFYLTKIFVTIAWLIPGRSHRWARKVKAERQTMVVMMNAYSEVLKEHREELYRDINKRDIPPR